MGVKLRELKGFGLDEGVSTRLLVYVSRLIKNGLSAQDACTSAIRYSLTDEEEVMDSIGEIVDLYFGDLDKTEETR